MKTQTNNLEKLIDDKLVQARKENLRRLSDIEHRLEYVDTIDGVEYINDAKSADANSAYYSLDNLDRDVVWIISSCLIEEDYNLFYEMDLRSVKAVVVLGKNPQKMEEVFKGRIESIERSESILEATSLARSLAREGDAVLYAPSFTDFDSYTHYKELGQRFRKAVREMML